MKLEYVDRVEVFPAVTNSQGLSPFPNQDELL